MLNCLVIISVEQKELVYSAISNTRKSQGEMIEVQLELKKMNKVVLISCDLNGK